MTQATGLNLSAFGVARRPVLAVATLGERNDVRIALKTAEAFSGKFKLADRIEETFANWRQGLLECARPIAVDVAIDIDWFGVGARRTAPAERRMWELTLRPLDFAFYGDAPLTDRVGDFGVRFRALLASSAFEIGDEIFEACPRASVELFDFKGQYRDGSAHHGDKGWRADDRNKRGDKLMAKILEALGVNPQAGAEQLDSDDLDAILCALTALGAATGRGVIAGDELSGETVERCARRANAEPNEEHAAPQACAVLAQPFWETLAVSR